MCELNVYCRLKLSVCATQGYEPPLSASLHSPYQIPSYSVPLGIAAEKGHILTVERLVEGGANINQQNEVVV